MSISPILLANLFQHAEALTALCAEREEIMTAVRDFHYALDTRQHGLIAADRALNAIQNTLGMVWEPNLERKRREAEKS